MLILDTLSLDFNRPILQFSSNRLKSSGNGRVPEKLRSLPTQSLLFYDATRRLVIKLKPGCVLCEVRTESLKCNLDKSRGLGSIFSPKINFGYFRGSEGE